MPSQFTSSRILIVDDDEDDFFITADHLKQIDNYQFEIDWCFNYKKALEHLQQRTHDIYFVDYRLGAKTGLDLLKEAVKLKIEDPIILLTGKGNKDIDIEAMQIGATDYLVKTELNSEKLERCIRYALERSSYLKALRANERKYRNIFEQSKDAVFTATKEMKFKDLNSRTAELTGYSTDELRHLTVYDLMEDDGQKMSLQKMIEEETDIDNLELDVVTKEKEKKNCNLSASQEIDDRGQSYIQGILHDITSLKKAEKINLQIGKLAATGRLIRTLAHEVRNPLNNINMSIEQLMQEDNKDMIPVYHEIVLRNSDRIGDLITELLNSLRPSELEFERTSLQGVLDEAITGALDRITLQRINMKIKYSDEPAWISADRNKLRIAFLNIIVNALEAMENRKGSLEISVENDSAEHRVLIMDTGIGIPEENISRLFEPYFTSKRNGMGLGLASTLNILQSHKANIDVDSVVNVGTAFKISFPAIE